MLAPRHKKKQSTVTASPGLLMVSQPSRLQEVCIRVSSTKEKVGNKLIVGSPYYTATTYEFLKSKTLEVLAALYCILLPFLIFFITTL